MKAYIIYGEEGEYDDYQQWVEAVYLVPDDFDACAFRRQCRKEAGEQGLVRLTKKGYVYNKDYTKGARYISQRLDEEFEKIMVLED